MPMLEMYHPQFDPIEVQLQRLNDNIERYLRFLRVPSGVEEGNGPKSLFVGLPMSEEEQAIAEYAKETGKGYVETE